MAAKKASSELKTAKRVTLKTLFLTVLCFLASATASFAGSTSSNLNVFVEVVGQCETGFENQQIRQSPDCPKAEIQKHFKKFSANPETNKVLKTKTGNFFYIEVIH